MNGKVEPDWATLNQWAVRNKFRPGAIAVTTAGEKRELTSWPFFDKNEEGADVVCVMARRTPGDPTTNEKVCWPNWELRVVDPGPGGIS